MLKCTALLVCVVASVTSQPQPFYSDIDYAEYLAKTSTQESNDAALSYSDDVVWDKAANNKTWPFQQAAGVAIDNDGSVLLFHRGPNVWDAESFDYENKFIKGVEGVIKGSPVIRIDPSSGARKETNVGTNVFALPHGISVDKDGNLWMTDIALHQVLMFAKNDLSKPKLVLGEAFVPGSGSSHFCKPTEAIRVRDLVFVSDGYCNSRVAVFNLNGTFITEFGQRERMIIVHSLSISEKLDLACVSSREDGRIVCFSAGLNNPRDLGTYKFTVEKKGRVYSAKLQTKEVGNDVKALLIGTGISTGSDGLPQGSVFVQDIINNLVWADVSHFSNMEMPHAIAVQDNLESFYVVDCETGVNSKIFKFKEESQV